MKHTIFFSDTRGDTKNCLYLHAADLLDSEQLHTALQYDHVLAEYRNGYRTRENFIRATVIGIDIDNDHSDEEEHWVSSDDLRAMLPTVSFVLVYSRHHLLEKGTGSRCKSPRPRFHVLFPIGEVTDPAEYEALKHRIADLLPFADRNALDAARMFFGTENPDFRLYDGPDTIASFLSELEEKETEVIPEEFIRPGAPSVMQAEQVIPVGRRNTVLHSYALSVLTRYGDSEKAHDLYRRKAENCEDPLSSEELTSIWKSAVKYYRNTISVAPGYLQPDEYNILSDEEQEIDWEDPVPIDFFKRPDFPFHALPEIVREYVLQLSREKGAPAEMAACYALAILALCNQKKYVIRAKPGWIEPLNLYILIIAEKSERKSQIVNAMTEFVLAYQNDYNKNHRVEFDLSRADLEHQENRLKKIKKLWDSGKATRDEVMEAEKELNKVRILSPIELIVDDTTSEALCRQMAANDEKMAVLSTEGDVFGNICERYSSDPNIGIWLKGYSGDYYKSSRIGRDGEELQNPALTIGIASQPATLQSIMGSKNLDERGLTARFLISMPKSLIGTREFETSEVTETVKQQFRDLICNMLETEPSDKPSVITLSPEAYDLLHAFYDEVEAKLLDEYSGILGWAGKLVGNVLRIAGNLCRASEILSSETFDENNCYKPLVVSGETMQNAIEIGRYFTAYALVAFSPCCDLTSLTLSEKILKHLKEKKIQDFTPRELTRHLSTGSQKKIVLEPALELLAEHGYIALTRVNPVHGNGRPPKGRYVVNPLFLKSAA